ncbi:hypothetical protein HNV12_00370 [Methanococcoides sp. SA1]|nr:hypothetical protein [Methanococcoides sp. SA1]
MKKIIHYTSYEQYWKMYQLDLIKPYMTATFPGIQLSYEAEKLTKGKLFIPGIEPESIQAWGQSGTLGRMISQTTKEVKLKIPLPQDTRHILVRDADFISPEYIRAAYDNKMVGEFWKGKLPTNHPIRLEILEVFANSITTYKEHEEENPHFAPEILIPHPIPFWKAQKIT